MSEVNPNWGMSPEINAAIADDARRRVMKSSTFKAIASLEEVPPEQWDEGLLDEVIEDVIAVDRARWFERAVWLFIAITLAVGGYLLGWSMKPEPHQENVQWDCTVVFDTKAGDKVDCQGVQ